MINSSYKKILFLALACSSLFTACGLQRNDQSLDVYTVREADAVTGTTAATTTTTYQITTTAMDMTSSTNPTISYSDDNIIKSTSDKINIHLVDNDSTFTENSKSLFAISADIISFASDIPIETESITEIYDAEDFANFISERNQLWGSDMSKYTIDLQSEVFKFNYNWYQNYSYAGQSDLRYFVIESKCFDPYCFVELDDDNARYDKTTNTVYIPLKNGSSYAEYISVDDPNRADLINQQSVATYCLFFISAGDYDTESDIPLNIILIKPTTNDEQ